MTVNLFPKKFSTRYHARFGKPRRCSEAIYIENTGKRAGPGCQVPLRSANKDCARRNRLLRRRYPAIKQPESFRNQLPERDGGQWKLRLPSKSEFAADSTFLQDR